MKFGIYIWHKSTEPTEYCIGEWNPAAKDYDGLTHEEAANKRIKAEQGKVGVFTENYVVDAIIVEDFKNFTKKAGADKEVHKTLKRFFGESVNIKGEWFKLPKSYKNPLDIFKHAIKATAKCKAFTPERPLDYGPRKGSQDIAIDKVTQALKDGKKKFLLGCKCRFGKTFTSYEIIAKNNLDNVLIMTFRPSDTKEAWLSDLNSHQDFKDYQFFNQKEIKAFSEYEGKKVLFISFQKAKVSPEFEDVKKLHFDFVIVDEDQIGAHRIENRDLINEIDNEFILVLTGTPELEIMSNEFGDDFYKFDYIDEQELKNKGLKEYADMPKLNLYSFYVEDKFTETISTKNGFALSEMFAVEDSKFKYPVSIKKFLDYISAESESADFDIDGDDIGIFANPKFDLDHGLWKLPSIKACKLLKDILNKHNYFKSFAVEVLPESDKSPKELEDFCKKNDRTISLTVMKNTVGVTVKPWTYTMSLYGGEGSSLTTYIQYIFRAGSPGKKEFYSFDFCPSRVLDVVDSFAVARCADKTNDNDYTKAVANVINYLPVFAYNGSGKFIEMKSDDLFKQISYLTTERACRNLLLKDFEFLKEFKDDIADVDVNSGKPTISKNDALKKLKKELDKKQKESSGKKEKKEISDKDFFNKMFQAFKDIYSWIKYSDGVENLEDFIEKLNSYKGTCEEFFGFSEDFITSLVAVIESSKRNFGIAIERFKNLKFNFAMEDVPEELAERMVEKLKTSTMICDYACSGPSLLKAAKKKFLNAKLFAYNPDGIGHKLKRILEKELGNNVNIIKEMKEGMNFDKIIMNPPYDKNLHLKILREAMKHSDELVNLSPIRWLQDPLAEYKKSSDWKKFEDIRKRIETLDVVSAKDAQQLFGSSQYENLGIYHLTKDGGANIMPKPFISQALFDKVNLPTYQGKHMSLYDVAQKPNFEKPYVKMSYFHGNVGAKDWVDVISPQKELAFSTNVSTGTFTVNFDTQEEAENFFAYCQTKFVKACNANVKTNIRWPGYAVPFMPTYTHAWTDEDLYTFFHLTENEIDIIEKEIR